MAHVSPKVRRTAQAHLGVHVGSVHVHLPAVAVDDVANGTNTFLEDAVGRGVSDHQRRQAIAVLLGFGL